MDNRQINEDYAEIGRELIESKPDLEDIKNSDVSIIYLSSTLAKKKNDKIVFGQCEKVAEKYKWSIPCDFTITLFEPNIKDFTDDQIRILIFHELLHVGIKFEDEETYYIKGHDLEDFKTIIDMFGTDWDKIEPFSEDPK